MTGPLPYDAELPILRELEARLRLDAERLAAGEASAGAAVVRLPLPLSPRHGRRR